MTAAVMMRTQTGKRAPSALRWCACPDFLLKWRGIGNLRYLNWGKEREEGKGEREPRGWGSGTSGRDRRGKKDLFPPPGSVWLAVSKVSLKGQSSRAQGTGE
jgi:hypothetical protein